VALHLEELPRTTREDRNTSRREEGALGKDMFKEGTSCKYSQANPKKAVFSKKRKCNKVLMSLRL
jgi:hypothetical protein